MSAKKNTSEKSFSLPTADEAMETLALAEAERATEALRREQATEAQKQALIDRLTKPSGVSDEEAAKRAAVIIQNAIKNGLTEVQVYRFPNSMCTDRGRAINQQEPGWENTLTGIPKEIFEFWKRVLKPRGYKFYAEIIEFPDGLPGDVGLKLKWG
jgi:hypothetical protein